MRVGTYGKSRPALLSALANREPFTTSGGLRAVDFAVWDSKALPAEHAATYKADAETPGITYTVLYYDTPLGWVLRDGTVRVPEWKYSSRTTHKQNLLRAYL